MKPLLSEHLGYVSDAIRLERFRAAIAQTVKPGDIVADLGCGSGVLGLACLRAGAARVLAIDSTNMLEVARETFARAGFSDRCEFIRGQSYRVGVPFLADVVVCDHVGFFGFDYDIVELLKDARRRFLKPRGVVLPSRMKLMLAGIESHTACEMAYGWRSAKVPPEFHWLGNYAVNTKYALELGRDELITSPCELGAVELGTDGPDFFSWKVELVSTRSGELHGLAGWFDCELAEGIWMTNSPVSGDAIDRPQAFFPIAEAAAIEAGDRILVTVMARPRDDLIAWSVDLPGGRSFQHSTWHGFVLGDGDILRVNPDRVPRPTQSGEARRLVLEYCDGRRTAKQVEQLVLQKHWDLFPTREETSRFVGQVLSRDTY